MRHCWKVHLRYFMVIEDTIDIAFIFVHIAFVWFCPPPFIHLLVYGHRSQLIFFWTFRVLKNHELSHSKTNNDKIKQAFWTNREGQHTLYFPTSSKDEFYLKLMILVYMRKINANHLNNFFCVKIPKTLNRKQWASNWKLKLNETRTASIFKQYRKSRS